MTLEQLRIFVVVAEYEHVTQASYALGMVQSAVSKAVATLEGELAFRLFDRVGRNIRLTEVGAAVRDNAIVLLEHADRFSAWTSELRLAPRHEASARATPPCAISTHRDRIDIAARKIGSNSNVEHLSQAVRRI